jgi:hypothetical protein
MKIKKSIRWLIGYELAKVLLVMTVFSTTLALVHAHNPIFPTPQNYNDFTPIEKPTISTAYYGNLQDFPHTYELELTEPTKIYTELLVPGFVSATDRSVIIVKKERRGVTEVVRLNKKDEPWPSFYEFFGGDIYRRGPVYETQLEAGSYLLEVSTPDNEGKYVLVVGEKEYISPWDYFRLLGDIYDVKIFMEKPGIMVLQSPFYFVPIGITLIGLCVFWYRHRHKFAEGILEP